MTFRKLFAHCQRTWFFFVMALAVDDGMPESGFLSEREQVRTIIFWINDKFELNRFQSVMLALTICLIFFNRSLVNWSEEPWFPSSITGKDLKEKCWQYAGRPCLLCGIEYLLPGICMRYWPFLYIFMRFVFSLLHIHLEKILKYVFGLGCRRCQRDKGSTTRKEL